MSKHGGSVGVIETLSTIFSERYIIFTASDKKNQLVRLIDMLYTIWKHRKNAGLVLIDSYSTQAFWYAYLSARFSKLLGIPFVPFLHGGNFPNRLPVLKKYTPNIFGQSAINISPSIYLKEAFEKHGFKIKYIPNSISLELYPFKHRTELKPHILWVRAFEKTYNPNMAVDVLKLVKNKYPEATLCMIGSDKDGTMVQTKELATKENLIQDIEFTGYMAKKDWLEKSTKYDIFINTTNVDNHPVSVVEAMALGLPIVSTNAGGIPFFITQKQNGLMCEISNATQMADMIVELLQNSELASTLSINGRKTAEQLDLTEVKKTWWEFLDPYTH